MHLRLALLPVLLCSFLGSASLVNAETIWWFGDADDRWMNALNWELQSTHMNALPMDGQDTYITTSDHAGLDLPQLPPATVEDGDQATTGQLYIGGWHESLDGHHGDPAGRTGTLDITGGDLTVGWVPGVQPPCWYVRLGYRGATGFIRQSGGRLYTCNYLAFGFWSADSLGTYELTGGTIETLGFDIGLEGVGVFEMSGGEVVPLSSFAGGPPVPGQMTVGSTYFRQATGSFLPGVGLMRQTGGEFTTEQLMIGRGPGSAGIVTVRGTASSVHTLAWVSVGDGGSGALVQTGGSVQAETVFLGRFNTGMGQYTVAGGTVLVDGTSASSGFFNGNSNSDGAGSLTIVGTRTPVNGGFHIANRYDQSARSRLTFVFDDTPGRVSIIWVGGTATFAPGAALTITPVDSSITLASGQAINLMVADEIVGDAGIAVENPQDWSISVIRDVPFFGQNIDVMQGVYCPGC